MAKKKRQGDPSRDACESTDSEMDAGEDSARLNSCPHVGKSANLSAIKKTLKIAWVKVGQCTACVKESKVVSPVKKREIKDPKLAAQRSAKLSLIEIRKEQLERAKAEQRAAAEKLKKEREQKDKPPEEPKIITPAEAEILKIADDTNLKDDEKTEIGDCRTNRGSVVESSEPPSIWLCLKCGSQGCANNTKRHSHSHYKAPRSDLHSLVVNIATWSIWCYECEQEINVDSHKKLYEAVEYVKKIKEQGSKTITLAPKGPNNFGVIKPLVASGSSSSGTATYTKGGLLRVKGLSNLGNTCFFNSVMQCLNQTHLLTHLLDLQATKGVSLDVPGFEATAASTNDDSETDGESQQFESFTELSVQLAEGGPMVTSLAAFFKEMHNVGKTTTFSPGHLFSQVVRQAPKFRGMQQQDSHELLRYLMDGLRSEEQKRQKSAILKHFGLTEKTDPKSVVRSLRRKLQVYGRHANHTLLDKIFSGQLVSTIVCEDCHHSSRTYEQFLDISLPVVEDKPHKPVKKSPDKKHVVLPDDVEGKVVCCGVQEAKRTKSQMKKDKKNRRDKRKGAGLKESSKSQDLDSDDDGEQKIKEELRGSEEKVFENGVEETDNRLVITQTGFHRLESVDTGFKEDEEEEEDDEGNWEWDYGESTEDKQMIRTKAPIVKNDGRGDESDYLDVYEQEVTVNGDEEERGGSSERTGEVTEEEEEEDVEETGASSNGDVEDNDEDDVKVKWVVGKNYLNNLKQLDDLMQVRENLDPHMSRLCRGMSSLGVAADGRRLRRKMEWEKVQVEWTARTLTSLAPRYQAQSGECSVYSCLNSFTQSELLTGSNKWACDKCTEIAATASPFEASEECSDSGSRRSQTVYSSASKQMLIFSPPAVLTLQLKRFQQTISGCKKVNKHVSFPLELDLAAFCSSTCVAMPNVEIGSKVLYSLYGVVEHSGSLRGGHYVSYVKVRPASGLLAGDVAAFFNPPQAKASDVPAFLEEIDRKLRRKPKAVIGQKEQEEKEQDATNNNSMTVGQGARKWFHVSDSSVAEVAEDKVLRAQAYLLFYERIL